MTANTTYGDVEYFPVAQLTLDIEEEDPVKVYASRAFAKTFVVHDTRSPVEAHETTGNITAARDVLFASTIEEQIKRVFREAIGQDFEDGMESTFSRAVVAIIEERGRKAIDALTRLVAANVIDTELISEALRWIGSMDDAGTHDARRELLEGCLGHSHYLVRDGAICGLSGLEDATSISEVKRALDREPYPQLAEDLEQLLCDLEQLD